MKPLYTWENHFHNTTAKTTLSPEELEDIRYRIYSDPREVSEAEKKRVSRLEKRLCGIAGCECGPFMHCVD
jgi:hypothetical protein